MRNEFQSTSNIKTLKVNISLKLSQSVHCCFKINIVLVEANDESKCHQFQGKSHFVAKHSIIITFLIAKQSVNTYSIHVERKSSKPISFLRYFSYRNIYEYNPSDGMPNKSLLNIS